MRNKIDEAFKKHFNSPNWLTEKLPPAFLKQVVEIEVGLNKAKKPTTNSNILAKLNFGFWTTLFNRKYARFFWKPLHRIFINMPKQQRKRTEVSSRLNHIRTFRNRIYHYEPIIWNNEALIKKRNEIKEITFWLDEDTFRWVNQFDRTSYFLNKLLK